AAGRFELLVSRRRSGQLLLQRGGEVRVGGTPEGQQRVVQPVPLREHLGASGSCAVFVATALARTRKLPVAKQVDQAGLPAVHVAVPRRLLEPDLPAQAANRIGILMEIIAMRAGLSGQVGERVKRSHEALDLSGSIERRSLPPRGVFSRVGKGPPG